MHGDPLADHMAAMLRAERAHAAEMAAHANGVLAAGRAAAGLAQRVQSAVLALIHADDPAECVSGEFPGILAIDDAGLCIGGLAPGMRTLPAGTVAALLDGRDVVFRDPRRCRAAARRGGPRWPATTRWCACPGPARPLCWRW